MNNSNGNEDNPHGPAYTAPLQVLLFMCLCTIIILSIVGNALVCIAIIRYRKLRKIGNFFLLSLACSDLTVAFLVMPFATINDIFRYWPFSKEFCNVWISFDILSATASILHLCAISLDRYTHMSDPFLYDEKMTPAKCLTFIILIWLASLLLSFLPINAGWHQLDKVDHIDTLNNSVSPTCTLDLGPTYAIVSSSISFYIPCFIMIVMYGLLYKLACKHRKQISQKQCRQDSRQKRFRLRDNKALFTLGVIMGLFLLSWIPFFTVNLIHSFCKCVSPLLFQILTWLGYFNSAQNPIIYSIFNTDFRDAFKELLFCANFPFKQICFKRAVSKKKRIHLEMTDIDNGGTSSTLNGLLLPNGTSGDTQPHPTFESQPKDQENMEDAKFAIISDTQSN